MAACFFLGLKEVLPKKIFAAAKGPSKNVLIDSMLIDDFELVYGTPVTAN